MNKIKDYILALFAMILVIAGFGIYIYANTDKERDVYSIAVVVDDTNVDRWRGLRQGIDLAAKDNGVEISFATIGKRKSVNEQSDMLDMQLEHGADAIIADLVDSSYMKTQMEQIAYQIPVLFIESGVDSRELLPIVGPDWRSMGKELAEAVLNEMGSASKIGIVIGNEKKLSGEECLAGIMSVLEENGMTTAWQIKEGENLKQQIRDEMERQPADCIVTIENAATEAAVDYNVEAGENKAIFGVGNTEKAVYYLDKQMIKTLIVPDEFTMGYLSVDMMSHHLKYGTELEHKEVSYRVVTKENLYNDENQKMLFPIAQ